VTRDRSRAKTDNNGDNGVATIHALMFGSQVCAFYMLQGGLCIIRVLIEKDRQGSIISRVAVRPLQRHKIIPALAKRATNHLGSTIDTNDKIHPVTSILTQTHNHREHTTTPLVAGDDTTNQEQPIVVHSRAGMGWLKLSGIKLASKSSKDIARDVEVVVRTVESAGLLVKVAGVECHVK
jgi:hypothetical protein